MQAVANTNTTNNEPDNGPMNDGQEDVLLIAEDDDFFADLGQARNARGDCSVEAMNMLCRDELNRYKYMPSIPASEDPLKWWADNESKFPVLSVLAIRYLAIPATSAPSERLWSIASLIITKTRTQLHGHVVTDMIFLKENGHILQKHAAEIEKRVRMLPTVYNDTDQTMNEEDD